MWIPLVGPHLSKFCFIVPDLRGHGKSGRLRYEAEHENFYLLGDDLQAVREHAIKEEETFSLVGFSMGTIASIQMMSKFGTDGIDGYLHIDHSVDFGVDKGFRNLVFLEKNQEFKKILGYGMEKFRKEPEKYLAMKLSDLDPSDQEFGSRLLKFIIFESTMTGFQKLLRIKNHDDFWSMIRAIAYFGTNVEERFIDILILGHAYIFGERDFREELRRIDVPTQFMVGKINNLFSFDSQMTLIRECQPNSAVHVFEKSGHDLAFREPIKFMKIFKAFLNG